MTTQAVPRHRAATGRTVTLTHARSAGTAGAGRHSPVPVSAALPGRYRYTVASASWWWSPEMFLVHGLAPGAAEPSVDLLLQHQHPDDRPLTRAALAAATEHGRPFCLEARLHTDDRRWKVVLVGEPEFDDAGSVTAVSGLVAPVSESCPGPDDHEALVTEIAQLRTAMVSRAAIEQAKGIIMLLTGCGEQVAFNLLAHISSHTHRKVRDVAVAITESASGRGRLPADVQAILRDACPPGSAMH